MVLVATPIDVLHVQENTPLLEAIKDGFDVWDCNKPGTRESNANQSVFLGLSSQANMMRKEHTTAKGRTCWYE
jgi:hypothetical protein